MKIVIISDPDLNLLGKREPGIYGNRSFNEFLQKLRRDFTQIEIDYYQSNIEGEFISELQEMDFSYDGIVLNAGAYTHVSIAFLGCIRLLTIPVVEVHISSMHAREEFHHKSMISSACLGVIAGPGLSSYKLAIETVVG